MAPKKWSQGVCVEISRKKAPGGATRGATFPFYPRKGVILTKLLGNGHFPKTPFVAPDPIEGGPFFGNKQWKRLETCAPGGKWGPSSVFCWQQKQECAGVTHVRI